MAEDNGGGAPANGRDPRGDRNVRYHLAYIGWLARTRIFRPATGSVTRTWCAAHLSAIDYLGACHGTRTTRKGVVRADKSRPVIQAAAGRNGCRVPASRTYVTWISEFIVPQMQRHKRVTRVFDALWRRLWVRRRAAEPGPFQTPALGTVPALRSSVKERCTESGTRQNSGVMDPRLRRDDSGVERHPRTRSAPRSASIASASPTRPRRRRNAFSQAYRSRPATAIWTGLQPARNAAPTRACCGRRALHHMLGVNYGPMRRSAGDPCKQRSRGAISVFPDDYHDLIRSGLKRWRDGWSPHRAAR